MIKPTKIRSYHSRWSCSRFGQSWFDASRVASFEQPAMGNNGVLGRVPECPWPRPRRSTRRPRCRRSSWGRGRENLSKSNAIELALMAKAPPSIYNLRGKHQLLELGIQCDWHILYRFKFVAKVASEVGRAKDNEKAQKMNENNGIVFAGIVSLCNFASIERGTIWLNTSITGSVRIGKEKRNSI